MLEHEVSSSQSKELNVINEYFNWDGVLETVSPKYHAKKFQMFKINKFSSFFSGNAVRSIEYNKNFNLLGK